MNPEKPQGRGQQADPENRLERREQILNSAQACFDARGFHATSTLEISKAAGISSAGLYHYFSSKDELIGALIERELKRVLSKMDALKHADDFFAELEDFYYQISTEELKGFSLGLRIESFALATRSKPIAKIVDKVNTTFLHELVQVVENAQRLNQVDPTLDPKLTAAAIMNITWGFFTQMCRPENTRADYLFVTMNLLKAGLSTKQQKA
ncbi:MAG: TetR/AcrR family transcriptional regulator [Cellvibrionaceae bacterium]|nr:TetR/AcrR family transcriptional regulator [Cellvibrionaceae bacterium]